MSWKIEITNVDPQIDDQLTAKITCTSGHTLLEVVTYDNDNKTLPESIKDASENAEVIMVAYFKESGNDPKTCHEITESLSWMNIDSPLGEPTNGIVIAYNLFLGEVSAKKKPTKGTVSNGLG